MFEVRTKFITICMVFMLSIAATIAPFGGDAILHWNTMSVLTSSANSLPVYLNHESGDFREYDVHVTDGGDLTVSHQAGLGGTAYGLSVLVDDGNRAHAEKILETASTTGVVRARFHIDPNSLEMGNLAQVSFLFFINSDGKSNFALMKLMKLQGYYFLRGVMIDDNGVHRETDVWPITDEPHFVEIQVRRSSSASSRDATYEAWIDGYPRVTMTGVDSYERFSDFRTVSAGLNGVGGTVRGTYYLDEIMVNEDGSVIGPIYGDSISPTPTVTARVTPTTGPIARPGVPKLVSPARGVLVATLRPTFDWKDSSPLAHHYQIQVATNNRFTTLSIDETNILASTFTPVSDLLPGKLYYWRVRAINVIGGASAWSAPGNFKTPLTQPTLVAPAEGESLLTDRPAFEWGAAPGATSYVLQVSSVDNFSTLIVNTPVSSTAYTMTKDLPQHNTLYWRVQAKSLAVKGPWSAKWMFKTGNPPSMPVLASPANGILVKDYTPLFNWKDSTVPRGTNFKHYELQVDDNNNFASPVIETTSTVSQFRPLLDLASNTKFYWRVRAVNIFGWSDQVSGWSPVRSFRTVIRAPQSLAMVLDDANPLQPSFSWDAATGTGKITGYTIQISTSANFSTLLVNSTTINSGYELVKNLPAGTIIYWRVRVNGANGPSAWTTTQFVIS